MGRLGIFVLMFAVALGVVLGSHGYLWLRLVRDPALPAPWRQLATGSLLLLALSLPATFALSRQLSPQVAREVLFVPYLWMGLMLLLVTLLGGADLLRLLLRGGMRLAGTGFSPGQALLVSRALALSVILAVATLAVFGVRQALGGWEVRQVEVTLPRLPPSLDGFTLVQLTDLHLGPTLGRDWLERLVTEVAAQQPDLIAITGDLADGLPEPLREETAALARLRAAEGVWFVTGNHEYYSGVQPWLEEVERLGMRALRNERMSVRAPDGGVGFELAGVDDPAAGRMAPGHGPDLARALAGWNGQAEVVLLAHQPLVVKEAAARGVGLVLTGHTHGGQFWPWMHLVPLQQPYVSGLHRHGETWLYVSEGTGFWGPPLRLGTRNEITVIRLRSPAMNRDLAGPTPR